MNYSVTLVSQNLKQPKKNMSKRLKIKKIFQRWPDGYRTSFL